ncbi:CehA/McbA family metallohydrolase [Nakamurella lactea]|uniref:CehA/McbA family metallohydrolase n=1 Tax=Nakamurella lactea TaxID=459515 RepID=UPI00040FAF40|nr:CehA/McbA family metallohydrolase [Nakamurella lactea]
MTVIRRTFTPQDRAAATWHYLPFDLPAAAGAFTVTLDIDRDDAVIDLGCHGPQGFRGWSGGARRSFCITDDAATPGYLPGVTAGGWQVVLGLHRVPAPGVRVTVEITTGGEPEPALGPARPTPQRPPRPGLPDVDGMRWLAGDLHCHTVHSDGADSIDQVAAHAVAAGLDFLAVTDHNTVSHHRHLPTVSARSGIQLIPGQEVTTWRGHANAFGDIGWIDFRNEADRWFTDVADRGGLISVNHPLGDDCAWRYPGSGRPDLLETWHSGWFDRTWGAPLAYRQAFAPGATPVGGSDYHRAGSDAMPGFPTTWVLTDGDDVLGGLRAGRTAISAGPGAPLLVRIDDDFLALGADGLLLATLDGYRLVLDGDRVTVPARPGLAWLEDAATGIQGICAG